MKKPGKIVIVGAGPVGCYLGQLLKHSGFEPLLLEEHSEVGKPVSCAGIVGANVFSDMKLPVSKKSILNTIDGAKMNFQGSAFEVLQILEELVGPEGTLLMPAHVYYRPDSPLVFDARKSPAHTGILCELLRRRPGAVRSLHPTHSTCGIGPLAEQLLSDHHRDGYSCGPLSPYARLAECDAQILGLGLPAGDTTFFHVVEDLAPDRFPVRINLTTPVQFAIKDESGRTFRLDVVRRDRKVLARMKFSRVVRHLTEESMQVFSFRGVPAFLAHAKPLLVELRALADRGVTIYG